MTRKNIRWESIVEKLNRGAIRKRTARRWYQRALAAQIKKDKATKSQTEHDTKPKD